MWRCKVVDVLDRLIPLNAWRGWLVGRHRERCSRCQALLASREEARRFLVRAEDVASGLDIWPSVRREIVRGSHVDRGQGLVPHFVWKRAAVLATVGLLAVMGLWVLRSGISVRTNPAVAETSQDNRFKLNFIRVGGEPATAYIYQSQGAEWVGVWAESNH